MAFEKNPELRKNGLLETDAWSNRMMHPTSRSNTALVHPPVFLGFKNNETYGVILS
jgi:hypothetical protein